MGVALHDKIVDKSEFPALIIEIDALRFNSLEKKTELPTAKEAVDYAILNIMLTHLLTMSQHY